MKVFLSSASRQTQDYRQSVLAVCEKRRCEVLAMERWGTDTPPPLEACLEKVRECDLFIVIWSPDLGSRLDSGITITQAEYEEAVARERPILALIPNLDEDAESNAYSAGAMLKATDDAKAFLKRLTDLTKGHVCAPFASAKELEFAVLERIIADQAKAEVQSVESAVEGETPNPTRRYIFGRYSLMATKSLVGRRDERRMLEGWWAGGHRAAEAQLMALVAYGGTGKSALAWHWLRHEVERAANVELTIWFSFYETGATYHGFVLRLASFLLDEPLSVIESQAADQGLADLEEAILDQLDRHRSVLILDGLERILIAYSRLDAQRRDEAEYDEATDNQFTPGLGRASGSEEGEGGEDQPLANASVDETESQRLRRRALRDCQDARAERFLRCLPELRGCKTLITTRLLPTALQHGERCIGGVYAHPMRMLTQEDGADLLRSLGIHAPENELHRVVEGCSGYALLLSKLAGRIKKDRPLDADLVRWLADHSGPGGFDPWSLQGDLVNQKHHVLEFALGGIDEPALQILHRLAVTRGPLPIRVLLEELVGDEHVFPDVSGFDSALSDLRERDLLGLDHDSMQVDLHPLVRGRVWARMPSEQKEAINRSLRTSCGREYKKLKEHRTTVELGVAERFFDAALGGGDRHAAWQVLATLEAARFYHGDLGRVVELFDRFVSDVPVNEWHPEAPTAIAIALEYADVLIRAGRFPHALEVLESIGNGHELTADQQSNRCKELQFVLLGQGRMAQAVANGLEGVQRATSSRMLSSNLLYLSYTLLLSKHPAGQRASAALEAVLSAESGDLHMFRSWQYSHRRDTGGMDAAERFRNWAAAHGSPESRVNADKHVGCALLDAGEVNAALPLLEQARRTARRLGVGYTEFQTAVLCAEALVSSGRAREAIELLFEVLTIARRGELRRELAPHRFVCAKAQLALGNRELGEHWAHEAYRLAWMNGPPFHDRVEVDRVGAWMHEHGFRVPEDVPIRGDEELARLGALDFSILEHVLETAKRERVAKSFQYTQFDELSDEELRTRGLELAKGLDLEAAPGPARHWWEVVERECDPTQSVQTLERLAARGASLADLYQASGQSNTDDFDATFHYLDYLRLRKHEEAKKEGQASRQPITGDPIDPVDDPAWFRPYEKLSVEEMRQELEGAQERIGWPATTGSAKKWWEAFVTEQSEKPGLVLRLAVDLAHLESTITEFFLAYVYSKTDNILANLHYLRYTQLKRRSERRLREARTTTAEGSLAFVRCPSCRSLVLQNSGRCKRCGAALRAEEE